MRRFFAPEVVQTSQMDCGPAALASLLGGFGGHAAYGRLREACQTEVDGTSIDDLETAARRLGLDVEQVMLPVDHLLLAESAALPAILVVRQSREQTHFVVAWRRVGPWVQVMDPACGRRWMSASHLLSITYVHAQVIPADLLENWLRSDEFQAALTRRLRAIGASRAATTALRDEASGRPGWRGLAALDAAARCAAELVAAGGLRRGAAVGTLVAALARRAFHEPETLPDAYWFVAEGARAAPAATSEGTDEQVTIRGAVLIRANGRRPRAADEPPLPTELAAALDEPPPRPVRAALRMLDSAGRRTLVAGLGAALVVALFQLVEIVLLRGLIDLGRDLRNVEQRAAAFAVVAGVTLTTAALDALAAGRLLAAGRRLETRFRAALVAKLRRLHDRYFHSRTVPDMAERAHALRHLRRLPASCGALVRSGAGLLFTAGAIVVFDPPSAPLAALTALVALVIPLLFRSWITELDMRLRVHSGALSQFYFDSLQGLAAIRAHGAERVVRREQEALLVEWRRAARRHWTAVVLLEGTQLAIGFALAAWLLTRHAAALADTGGALLLAYWALRLPEFGAALAATSRQIPAQRNTLLRLLEPLAAPETPAGSASSAGDVREERGASKGAREPSEGPHGAAVEFAGVRVVAGGHAVLHELKCEIPAGAHVALVGPSGAGKSSFLGVLLGWHRPADGAVRMDGRPLDGAALESLRAVTAWVDPSVQLWNRSLVENLRFGGDETDATRLGNVCRDADVLEMLDKLPDGLQTVIGESGGLLSGGQGQRVRLGRALLRADARLVLLDEPFRGLDRERRRELLRRVREKFRGATLLLASHDLEETLEFDRVLVFDGGRIVEDGRPAELAEADTTYGRLLEAERRVQRDVWGATAWRRLRLDHGTLTEEKTR